VPALVNALPTTGDIELAATVLISSIQHPIISYFEASSTYSSIKCFSQRREIHWSAVPPISDLILALAWVSLLTH